MGLSARISIVGRIISGVASTQLSQLTLNPNAASLDAVQNAVQLGVSFSQTAGATNAVAQQMNSTLSPNASLQSQLVTLQGQLVQSALTAEEQVGSARSWIS
jgi:hypothetical protein